MNEDVRNRIKLRQWQEADFGDAVKLNREAKVGLGIPPETGSWESDMLGVEEIFLDGGGEFLVGYLGDELIVMGGFKLIDTGVAEVKRMRVSPKYHRMGLGSWLLGALEGKMRSKGIRTSSVSTLSAQDAALGLYRASGYEEVGGKPGTGYLVGFQIVSFKKEI